jgi:hypothetical protein
MDPKLKFSVTIGFLDTMHLRLKEEGATHRNSGCLNSSHLDLGLGMRRRREVVATLGTPIPSLVFNSLPVQLRTSLLGMVKAVVYSVCDQRTVSAWHPNGCRVRGGSPARNRMVLGVCGNLSGRLLYRKRSVSLLGVLQRARLLFGWDCTGLCLPSTMSVLFVEWQWRMITMPSLTVLWRELCDMS